MLLTANKLDRSASTRLQLTFLFFIFLLPFVNAQHGLSFSDRFELDSLILLPTDSIESYLSEYSLAKPELCEKLHRKLIVEAEKSNEHDRLGALNKGLAKTFFARGFEYIDSNVLYQEKALSYSKLAGNSERMAKINSELAIDYLNFGEREKAQTAAMSALEYYEKEKSETGIADIHNALASIMFASEDFERSIQYAEKTIAFQKKQDNTNATFRGLVMKLQSELKLGRYDDALQDAQACIDLSNAHDDEIPPNYKAMAYSFRGDVYDNLEKFDLALKDHHTYWSLTKEIEGEEIAENCRLAIGSTLSKLGRHVQAIDHLEAGMKIYSEQKDHLILEEIKDAINSYEAIGKHKTAFKYLTKLSVVKEKLHEQDIANLESEAIIKYETDKKDLELASKTIQLKQNSKIKMLYLGIVALLASMLCLLLYYYKKSKKIAADLDEKNRENELLLKEIHHRVKNNLQTIASLLSLQSQSITDQVALDAVEESKNRVTSMGIIHQKLYQKDSLASLEMSDYFDSIGKSLLESYGQRANGVKLEIDVPKIMLDVDTAVPIGLITNELITNSLKHAFKDGKGGVIKISFDKYGDKYNLTVADNGHHAEENGAVSDRKGFGSLLVQLLTKQLRGNMKISTENGTASTVTFNVQVKSIA